MATLLFSVLSQTFSEGTLVLQIKIVKEFSLTLDFFVVAMDGLEEEFSLLGAGPGVFGNHGEFFVGNLVEVDGLRVFKVAFCGLLEVGHKKPG